MRLTLLIVLASMALGTRISMADVFSGSLKPWISCTWQPGPVSSSRCNVRCPFRLMYLRVAGNIHIESAWTLIPSAGDPALAESDFGGEGSFRIYDPDRIIASTSGDGTTFSLAHDMDRLSVGLRTSPATFTAGRQAVYWGVARSVSPTDFLAPYRYGAADTEYRTGVDAFRAVFPVGMLSEVETGLALGEDAESSRSALWFRGRFYLLQTDATVLGARYRDNLMLGGSLNRTLAGGTCWLEAAMVDPGYFVEGLEEDSYWRLSAGFDRSWFSSALYGYLEYHFSSAGSDSVSGYPDVTAGPAVERGGVYLLGRHYLCPGVIWNPAPLWSFCSSALVNVCDHSAYLSAAGEYSTGQNTVLQFGLNLGLGEAPGEGGNIRSEFGSWPCQFYARVAHYL